MKSIVLSALSLTLLLACAANQDDPTHPRPRTMDKDIEIVFESSANLPGIADNVDIRGELRFTSYEKTSGVYDAFTIRFDAAEIDGAINYSSSSPYAVVGSEVVFTSELWPNATNPQNSRVRIKWNNITHPANGYKYAIEMRGQTLDPRVRPK